jgi:hypothetical protein
MLRRTRNGIWLAAPFLTAVALCLLDTPATPRAVAQQGSKAKSTSGSKAKTPPAAKAPPAPKQLTTKDLKAGDILVKLSDGTSINTIIRLGQKIFNQPNSLATHAGVMFDNNYIIEADGSGIVGKDLRVQNKKYGYIVFRSKNKNLADGAATFAKILFDVHLKEKNLKYALMKAATSVLKKDRGASSDAQMEKEVDRILKNKTHALFCSQLVVFVYQFVARQNNIPANDVFALNDALVSPSRLGSLLVSNTKYFTEVGYLMPNER